MKWATLYGCEQKKATLSGRLCDAMFPLADSRQSHEDYPFFIDKGERR
jgi:hypothetical protein